VLGVLERLTDRPNAGQETDGPISRGMKLRTRQISYENRLHYITVHCAFFCLKTQSKLNIIAEYYIVHVRRFSRTWATMIVPIYGVESLPQQAMEDNCKM